MPFLCGNFWRAHSQPDTAGSFDFYSLLGFVESIRRSGWLWNWGYRSQKIGTWKMFVCRKKGHGICLKIHHLPAQPPLPGLL